MPGRVKRARRGAPAPSPERQLAGFLARFTPEVARTARLARARMRKLLPGAVELIYDNYNALVIGFGPTDRASEAIASLAVYPRWVNLFLLRGARLPDPAQRLRGSGSRVRHVTLEAGDTLDDPALRALVRSAVRLHPKPLARTRRRRTVIKAISPRQRPRRPAAAPPRRRESP
jgi:hypothetical protein